MLRAAGAMAMGSLMGVSGEALAMYTSPDAKGQKLVGEDQSEVCGTWIS